MDIVISWFTYGDLLRRTWDATVLFTMILILRKMLGERFLPSYRRALWGICMLCIIIPFRIPVFHSLYEYIGISDVYTNIEHWVTKMSTESFGTWHLAEIKGSNFVFLQKIRWSCFNFLNQVIDRYTLRYVLTFIWFAGVMIVFMVFIVRNIFYYRHLKKHSYLYGIRDNLPVYITDDMGGSCLFGIVNPEIYVGSRALDNENWRSLIVLHELKHYQAKDNLYRLFINLCAGVLWFHPLVWYCVKVLEHDCELACDDRILVHMDNSAQMEYGHCLIAMAGQGKRKTTAVSYLNNTTFKKRIQHIADYKIPTNRDLFFNNMIAAVSGLLFLFCIMS